MVRVTVAWVVAVMAMPAQPALAQNVFQSIFGYSSPAPRGQPGYPYSNVSPYRLPYSPFGVTPRGYDDEPQPHARGGTYRTLCVRMCDGYYFPISYATPTVGLAADADRCSASCGSDARLFYYPTNGGDIETMVDLGGLAYASLPNAFKYRKTLVQGCQCRPQPWSEAELRRHRAYAEGRSSVGGPPAGADMSNSPGRSAPGSASSESSVARAQGDTDGATDGDLSSMADGDQRAVARPEPIARQVHAPQLQPSWAFGSNGAKNGPVSRYTWPGDGGRY